MRIALLILLIALPILLFVFWFHRSLEEDRTERDQEIARLALSNVEEWSAVAHRDLEQQTRERLEQMETLRRSELATALQAAGHSDEFLKTYLDLLDRQVRVEKLDGSLRVPALSLTESAVLGEDMGPARSPVLSLWPWLALILVVSGLVLVAYHHLVRRPLSDLTDHMERVGSGDLIRVQPPRERDIGGVAMAFNRALDHLDLARRDLEQTVAAKTEALAGALDEQRDTTDRLTRVLGELEKTQALLVQQEKMAALGTLAGGVAHEFNNILGGIRGCAQELLDDEPDEDSAETLRVIERAASRGRGIVDGLRRFSGTVEPQNLAPVDLEDVALEVSRLLAPMAKEHGVLLTQQMESASCLGDLDGLHQVTLNLLRNAIEASSDGGEVLLLCGSEVSSAFLEVRDRGAGVRKEDEGRLFEPFFTTRHDRGGTGLGLAISHGIAKDHGGTLSYRRDDGGWTVLRLEIPKEREASS